MHIPLDRDSTQPLYQQIELFLRQDILSGSLPPDTRLPSSRQLARELGINRITVERAYAELEASGLIYAHMGSGTYTLPPPTVLPTRTDHEDGAWPLWQREMLNRKSTESMRAGVLPPAEAHPDPIAFDSGTGDSRLFPVEEFRRILQHVMRQDGLEALEYGDPRGYAPLRTTVAQVLTSQGLRAHPSNILITSGSQQSLMLVSQLLLNPGDTVLVEKPTYSGALDLLRTLKLNTIGIPVDEDGMQVEHLETLLQQQHPRLIYTMPNFHNPTGVCLSIPRRRQLVALAEQYNVPILEDDFVGDLRYDGHSQPALKTFDHSGNVIYMSTFSKMLMPGLRIGFLLAEGPVYAQLAHVKRVGDLASSNLIQHALATYITIGRYQTHLNRSRRLYRKRRDAMLAALARHLPPGTLSTVPRGGLFIWLQLPDAVSSEDLLPEAYREGVTFAPGTSFFPIRAEGRTYLRLNFATQPPGTIDVGIQRLGRAIRRSMGQVS